MQNRLFVRDFGLDTNVSYLEDLFSNVGTVQRATLEDLILNGVLRRVAYIEMSSAEEMSDCIDRFHGMKTDGHTMTVTEDKPHIPDVNFRPLKVPKAKKSKKRRTKVTADI